MPIIPSAFATVSTDADALSLGIASPMEQDKASHSIYDDEEMANHRITHNNEDPKDLYVSNSESSEDIDKVENPQFLSKTKNIQLLHKLISSVQEFGDFCMLDISSEGMCFTISDGNVCKVRLNLNKKIFSTYTFNGVWRNKREYADAQLYADDTYLSDLEDNQIRDKNKDEILTSGFDQDAIISIRLNLTSFLETINIHVKEKKATGMNVECTFIYEREGDPFIMTFEDDCIIEKCEMATFDLESYERKNKKNKDKTSKIQEESNEINIFNFENTLIDDSIFRLDSKKILFDIIIKSHILHDTIKDMNDLKTDKFILYCEKTSKNDETNRSYSRESKGSKIIFISKSKSDTIGFSKLIIPNKRSLVPEFKVFKPVVSINDPDEYELLDCFDLSLSSTYHFDYFSNLLKAIKLSRLIKIRKDMNGITSLLLLLGKENNNHEPDTTELYGSSIEFVTLESLSINELSALNIRNSDESLLSKLGYDNSFVKQLIKDDQDIQTIRVGTDGRFITLDDFFGNTNNIGAEFEQIENNPINIQNNFDDFPANNSYVPVEQLTESTTNASSRSKLKTKTKTNDNNILKLTEQLTMTLLGHPTPAGNKEGNIQIGKTMIEDDEDEYGSASKKRKHTTNNSNKRSKNNKTSGRGKRINNSKRKNDGIETVGGAIEIPLFI